jgi:hypothetical protein
MLRRSQGTVKRVGNFHAELFTDVGPEPLQMRIGQPLDTLEFVQKALYLGQSQHIALPQALLAPGVVIGTVPTLQGACGRLLQARDNPLHL